MLTVPLQMIEFYLILAAITKVSSGIFWRLMLGTLVMLLGGYIGLAVFQFERVRSAGRGPFDVWDQRFEVMSFVMLPPFPA